MVCVPTARVVVLKEAVATPPEVLTFTTLSGPSSVMWNWTVPVGVPVLESCGLMVAVKVTLWPNIDALTEEPTVVVLAAVPTGATTWPPESMPLLMAKLLSPL
jgi:hypothetical protein